MHIDSRIIDSAWESSESRRLADRIVHDVLRDHRRFTRAVKVNERAYAANPETDSLGLEKDHIRQMLSREEIDRKTRQYGDVSKNQDSLLYLLQHEAFAPMAQALCEEYPDYSFERSGLILYRRGNYMGWHTNSTNPINRIYFAYSDSGDSGFVHYDQALARVHDDRDEPGWNIREFEAGDGVNDPLYWHGVYSYCNRISIGFRVKPAMHATDAETGPALEGAHLFENEWAEGMQLAKLTANKRYCVPLRSLRHLLTPDRLQEVPLADIACKGADDEAGELVGDAEASLPGIVARGMPNPQGKPLRLIDGSRRLHRMLARGHSHGRFYVLTAAEVMGHLVVEEVPTVS